MRTELLNKQQNKKQTKLNNQLKKEYFYCEKLNFCLAGKFILNQALTTIDLCLKSFDKEKIRKVVNNSFEFKKKTFDEAFNELSLDYGLYDSFKVLESATKELLKRHSNFIKDYIDDSIIDGIICFPHVKENLNLYDRFKFFAIQANLCLSCIINDNDCCYYDDLCFSDEYAVVLKYLMDCLNDILKTFSESEYIPF